MNNITLVGRLTANPEMKTTAGGTNYTRFCIAVKRPQANNGQPTADFIDVVAWKKTAEIITQYCQKGREIAITGRLSTNNYTDNAGNNRKAYEVIINTVDLIGGNPGAINPASAPAQAAAGTPAQTAAPAEPATDPVFVPNYNPDDSTADVPLPFEL